MLNKHSVTLFLCFYTKKFYIYFYTYEETVLTNNQAKVFCQFMGRYGELLPERINQILYFCIIFYTLEYFYTLDIA